jgi:uncharacterized membrane protein
MRWLMIALLVSVAVLLVAVAGAARHILRHRRKQQSEPPQTGNRTLRPMGKTRLETVDEVDQEL